MRRGAVDYIAKPFTPEQIRQSLARIENNQRLENRVVELESMLSSNETLADFDDAGAAGAKDVRDGDEGRGLGRDASSCSAKAARGKSVLARALHRNSPRRDNAFVTVACPSLSRELLESELVRPCPRRVHRRGRRNLGQGQGGGRRHAFSRRNRRTPLEIQPKLLRLLQEREYERVGDPKPRKANVRVIAATNRRLEDLVKEGKFREDLYYRLNVITIELPPLRQRPLDLAVACPTTSQSVFAGRVRARSRISPPRRWPRCSAIPGPAICANCATSSSAQSF